MAGNNLFLENLRVFTGTLSDNDLLHVKIKRRVDMPADEDMGIRYSTFMSLLDLDRFIKRAGDEMTGDFGIQNNRALYSKSSNGVKLPVLKVDSTNRLTLGSINVPMRLSSSTDPIVFTRGIEFTLYHAGNANNTTTDWTARDLTADRGLWVNGETTLGDTTLRSGNVLRMKDSANNVYTVISGDPSTGVSLGIAGKTTTVLGSILKFNNFVVLDSNNFGTYLDNAYVQRQLTINGKPLTSNIVLSSADVGALPITGGTLTGALTVSGMVSSSTAVYTNATSAGNIWIGGDSTGGYASVVGRVKGETDWAWGLGLRFYQDGTWRVGDKKIFHEGYLPTAAALNVYTKDETYSRAQIHARYTTYVRDMRSAPTQTPKPSQFDPFNVSFWFNDRDVPPANVGAFHSGMTVTGWEAGTYASWQLASKASAGTSDQRLWFRASTGADTWGEWARVYTTLDKFTATDIGALPITGGSITGTLNLNGTMYINCKSGRNHIGFEVANGVYNWLYSDPNSDRLVISSKLTLGGGSIALAAADGSGSAITTRNWGAPSRWAVQETGDTHGWLWYCQRLTNSPTGTVEFNINGNLTTKNIASNTIWSVNADSYRIVYGNYGTYWRQDGTNLYLMLTNSGDQYGSYNGYRPFRVNIPTGRAHFDQGLFAGGGLHMPAGISITFNNSAEWASGVGWGLQEEGATGDLIFHRYSSGVWQNAPVRIQNDSTLLCGGNVNANDVYIRSDETLKKNLKPLTGSLAGVMQLDPTEYDKRQLESDVYDIHEEGLIAQTVEKVFPNAVHTDSASGLKSLKPYALIARLIGAVQEQQQQIEDMKKLLQWSHN